MSYNPSFNTFTNPMFTNNQYQPMRSGMFWVQGEAGAKSFLVGAGQTVPLFDSEDSVFYIKSADMSGMPTFRKFKYTEITNETPEKEPSVNMDKYLTKEEFYAEMAKIKGNTIEREDYD